MEMPQKLVALIAVGVTKRRATNMKCRNDRKKLRNTSREKKSQPKGFRGGDLGGRKRWSPHLEEHTHGSHWSGESRKREDAYSAT